MDRSFDGIYLQFFLGFGHFFTIRAVTGFYGRFEALGIPISHREKSAPFLDFLHVRFIYRLCPRKGLRIPGDVFIGIDILAEFRAGNLDNQA